MPIYHLKPATSSLHISLTLIATSRAPRVDPFPFADPGRLCRNLKRRGNDEENDPVQNFHNHYDHTVNGIRMEEVFLPLDPFGLRPIIITCHE